MAREQLILVTWRDAFFDYDEAPPREDYEVRTVGYLVDRNGLYLSLAAEVTPDGSRAITHIPLSSILSSVELEVMGPEVEGAPRL